MFVLKPLGCSSNNVFICISSKNVKQMSTDTREHLKTIKSPSECHSVAFYEQTLLVQHYFKVNCREMLYSKVKLLVFSMFGKFKLLNYNCGKTKRNYICLDLRELLSHDVFVSLGGADSHNGHFS